MQSPKLSHALALALTLLTAIKTEAAAPSGLQPWPLNPWYWSYRGEPVLLIGGSDDDNLFQWPAERLIPQLDRLKEAGGNVIRNTMSDRHDKGFELYPFKQLDSGQYDLEQWNPAYWNRFELMLTETAARRIFVQIEVWDRFDYTDNRGRNHWQRHPYHPSNNINYTAEASGFALEYPDHPGANKQAFFFTTPKQRNNTVVLTFQEAFVNKLLDHSLRYDHVLYCMDNETKAQPAWGEHWARLIKSRAKAAGKAVQVTEMWDAWDLTSEEHRRTFDHPELYDFVDVSQNNHNSGRKHWDNFLHVRNYLSAHPRPINTTKTYGADGNKFGHTDQDAVERFWRHLLGGVASARFHRPDSGIGLNEKAVHCLKAARLVESLVPFWELHPSMERLKAVYGKHADGAYVAEKTNQALVAFIIKGTMAINLELTGLPAHLELSWIDIDQGTTTAHQKIARREIHKLTPPHKSNWIVVIRAAG